MLDTWFSSALWPFSTLGWPEKTAELDRYYKTNVLITGNDIIFFWVARMMMQGIEFMGEVPFDDVYIHPKILDGYGETMSKSKGNFWTLRELLEKGHDPRVIRWLLLTTHYRTPLNFTLDGDGPDHGCRTQTHE